MWCVVWCVYAWVGTYDFNLPHPENPNNNPTTNSLATHREEWKGRLKCAARCDDPAARARLPPAVQQAHGKGVLLNRWVIVCCGCC